MPIAKSNSMHLIHVIMIENSRGHILYKIMWVTMKKDKKENLWVSKAFMNGQSQKFAVLSCEENFQVIHTS